MSLQKMLTRFNLTGPPFAKELSCDDFFSTDDLATAQMRLRAALEARSSVVVTGESGSGKTCLIRVVEEKLPAGNYRVHYVHNSMVNPRDFYRQLSMELGLEARTTAAALFRQVSGYFGQVATEHNARAVLILDEAHLLPVSVLAQLHILLNFERDSKPWLTLVLVGLPELRSLLTRDALKSLSTRLPTRIALKTLDSVGVREYVSHRLAKVGAKTQIFSEDALLLLAEATTGVLRKIDILAQQSLLQGLSAKGTVIDSVMVGQAIQVCEDVLR